LCEELKEIPEVEILSLEMILEKNNFKTSGKKRIHDEFKFT
jgi:hypothetical protein